ncbi:hypothetical protein EDB85DRAFT_1262338 [Lactarius pseudohatsudake]|nr:hypothetical protein EDB85DRAFT_1262338 [Lactarius pseudohatsudake]
MTCCVATEPKRIISPPDPRSSPRRSRKCPPQNPTGSIRGGRCRLWRLLVPLQTMVVVYLLSPRWDLDLCSVPRVGLRNGELTCDPSRWTPRSTLRGLGSYRTLAARPLTRCESGITRVPAGLSSRCAQGGLLDGRGGHKGETGLYLVTLQEHGRLVVRSLAPVIPKLELKARFEYNTTCQNSKLANKCICFAHPSTAQ